MKLLLFFASILLTTNLFSQTPNEKPKKIKNLLDNVTISGDWYFVNSSTKTSGEDWENEFKIRRSYFTIKKTFTDILSIRYTQDITVDKEGNDAGNIETRMKYMYLKIKPKWDNFITGSFFEVGLVHRPWLWYEQKVNVYRVQGNMNIERNKLFNSADLGVVFAGNIGPAMDKKYLKEVSSTMKGKYASFMVGIINGGGYSKAEENSNKVVEGIIITRPFANSIPQIQISHSFNLGKGNTEHEPNFNQFLFHGGYIGKHFIATGQFHFGKGDYLGKYVSATDPTESLSNRGYSFFAEYKFKNSPFAAFLRYDDFEVPDDNTKNSQRQIAGFKYTIYKKISAVLTGEKSSYKFDDDEYTVDLSLQVSF